MKVIVGQSRSHVLLLFVTPWTAESEKVGLKLTIQKTKIMASSPITSWQIDGETMEIISLQMVTAAMKLKDVYSLEEKWWPN